MDCVLIISLQSALSSSAAPRGLRFGGTLSERKILEVRVEFSPPCKYHSREVPGRGSPGSEGDKMLNGRTTRSLVVGVVLGAVLLLADFVWAADFWDKKPTEEWTAKEALKVLQKSPWAKQKNVMIARRLRRNRAGEVADFGNPDPRAVMQRSPPDRRLRNEDIISADPSGLASFLVRWESAPMVVAAFRRLEELGMGNRATFHGPPPRRPSDRYVITVKTTKPPQHGPMLFEQMDDNRLKRNARLITQHGEVRPSEVERSGVGGNAAVHFYFPLSQGNGPLLHPDREKVTFQFRTRRVNLKTKFTITTPPALSSAE